MKALPLTSQLLDELTGFDQSVRLSEFKRQKYLNECAKAIQVEPAEGYMCKGIVYALSNNFDAMYESFKIALKLAPQDLLIRTNFIATLGNYGRFEELQKLLPNGPIKDETQQHALIRSIVSTLDIDKLKEINRSFADELMGKIESLGLALSDVKDYINLFNNLMVSKKHRFGIIPSISWLCEEDEIYVYYDFAGSASDSILLMDELDQLAVDNNLDHVARKLTLTLLPLGNS